MRRFEVWRRIASPPSASMRVVEVRDSEATSKTAPCSAADVPATLARLLGEVSR